VYDRSGLIEAQKTMMAFGLDAEYAFGKLKNIGDIALGDKQKMQSLALAFSQMSSTGKLMGQDLLQMINAGFNPLEVISQKTGKSIAELKEEMGKGAISAEMVAQAFEWATEEGGRFYQGAETAAQTTAGKIAKVKDQIDDFKITLFEATNGLTAWIAEAGNMFVPVAQAFPLFQTIGKGVVNTVKWCGTNWSGFVNLVKSGVVSIGLNMGILKFSIVSAGGFFPWLRGVATAACRGISAAIMSIPVVGWIIAIGTAVIGTVALLWSKCEGFRRVVFGTWEAVKAAVSNAWQYVKTAAQVTWEVLKRVFTRLKEALSGLWERIKDLFTRLKAALAEAWNRIKPVLANIAEKVWGAVKVVMKVVAVVSLVVGAVIAAVGLLVKTVWDNLLKPLFQRLFSIVSTIVSSVATAVDKIVGFVTSIPERISTALDNVREFFTRAWDGITGKVRSYIDRITGFVKSIPEKISTALDNVRTFFADVWNSVTSTVRNDVDRITGFVKSIPERISTALDNVREFFARVWDSITGKVRSCIDRIKELVEELRAFVTETFAKAGDFIAGVWERVRESVGVAVDWIADKLGRIAGWVKTKMVDPIKDAFTGMWNVIRDVFDKILTKLGKLFAPIRELWNKLFPKDKMKDVKLAYTEGADKGTKSWEKSKNKGDVDTGKETIVLDGKDGLDGLAGVNGKSGKDGKTKKELSDGTLGKNAGTVAGKAQQITIKLENMVGTMNFNGGLRDNASNVESTLAEMMARILGMAETAA
jgi:tape measure domain-containing protein